MTEKEWVKYLDDEVMRESPDLFTPSDEELAMYEQVAFDNDHQIRIDNLNW